MLGLSLLDLRPWVGYIPYPPPSHDIMYNVAVMPFTMLPQKHSELAIYPVQLSTRTTRDHIQSLNHILKTCCYIQNSLSISNGTIEDTQKTHKV